MLISFTEEEFKHFEKLVSESGYTREAYIRSLINKVVPSSLITHELDTTIKLLRKIGNNMNQIAYIANATNSIDYDSYKKNYEELQGVIFDLVRTIKTPKKLEDNDGDN